MDCTPSEFFHEFWEGIFLSEEVQRWAEQIKNQFVEPEKFVESYLSFRSDKYDPHCDVDIEGLTSEDLDRIHIAASLGEYVKAAVQLFSEKRGIAHLQDDNTYFTALTLLRRAEKQLKKSAVEDRRKSCEG